MHDNSVKNLRNTLEEIARIESEHDFLGVSCNLRQALRDGQFIVTSEDLAEHVLDTYNQNLESKERSEQIPFSPPMPPEEVTPFGGWSSLDLIDN